MKSIEEANRIAEEYFWTACKMGRKYRRLAADADEAVEIALFTLVEASRTYEHEKGPFEPYLQRAIKFALISEHRKRTAGSRPQGVLSLDTPLTSSPDDGLTLMDCISSGFTFDDTDTAIDAEAAARELDATAQGTIALMGDGHSAFSAAHELGVSPSSVYKRMTGIRLALRGGVFS